MVRIQVPFLPYFPLFSLTGALSDFFCCSAVGGIGKDGQIASLTSTNNLFVPPLSFLPSLTCLGVHTHLGGVVGFVGKYQLLPHAAGLGVDERSAGHCRFMQWVPPRPPSFFLRIGERVESSPDLSLGEEWYVDQVPMGVIVARSVMPSCKFVQPSNLATIKAGETFAIQMKYVLPPLFADLETTLWLIAGFLCALKGSTSTAVLHVDVNPRTTFD